MICLGRIFFCFAIPWFQNIPSSNYYSTPSIPKSIHHDVQYKINTPWCTILKLKWRLYLDCTPVCGTEQRRILSQMQWGLFKGIGIGGARGAIAPSQMQQGSGGGGGGGGLVPSPHSSIGHKAWTTTTPGILVPWSSLSFSCHSHLLGLTITAKCN